MIKEKELLLKEVKEQIDQFGSFLVMRYTKLSANKANTFRRAVLQMGGEVEMMRKRMLCKAAESADIDLSGLNLDGHIGLIYSGHDALETAKIVYKFSQDNANCVEVLGGLFEGRIYDGPQMEMLSKLPGKDVMRAELLSVFEAPLSQTLAVIEALLTSVPHCLDNKVKLESGEG